MYCTPTKFKDKNFRTRLTFPHSFATLNSVMRSEPDTGRRQTWIYGKPLQNRIWWCAWACLWTSGTCSWIDRYSYAEACVCVVWINGKSGNRMDWFENLQRIRRFSLWEKIMNESLPAIFTKTTTNGGLPSMLQPQPAWQTGPRRFRNAADNSEYEKIWKRRLLLNLHGKSGRKLIFRRWQNMQIMKKLREGSGTLFPIPIRNRMRNGSWRTAWKRNGKPSFPELSWLTGKRCEALACCLEKTYTAEAQS